jgi:hypothetical protein
VVCDACTYYRPARLTSEGWDQPIFVSKPGEGGAFACTECGCKFTGELEVLSWK